MGKKMRWNNPQTYNEKLQWLKLYDRRPEYTIMVDKVKCKDYVAAKLGSSYIIPTIGVWDDPDKIDFDSLPDRFVLKCNHNSGLGMYICTDKSKLDVEKVKADLRKGLKENYFLGGREWPYKNVPRLILAEQYIDPAPGSNDLPDYKFFCFNGEVKALFIATDRQNPNEEVKFDFFDSDFNRLPFRQGHDNAAKAPNKPKYFDMMKRAASELSRGYPHIRVDFYEVGDKVFFGELTLFHFSGLVPFRPEGWDKIFGDMLTLQIES
ncbi:MAG: glycosyl transferase [Bacteroidales bacterium]|nr:glycosyl transferase [Bacteroidales bacterium]